MNEDDIIAWEEFKKQDIKLLPVNNYTQMSTKLDLHHKTVQEAYDSTTSFIHKAFNNKEKEITIITGLSGQIRKEFIAWVKLNKNVSSCTTLNGGGAFKIILKKYS